MLGNQHISFAVRHPPPPTATHRHPPPVTRAQAAHDCQPSALTLTLTLTPTLPLTLTLALPLTLTLAARHAALTGVA